MIKSASFHRSIVECFYHRASDGFHQLRDVIFGQTTGANWCGEFCHNLFIQSKPIPAEPNEHYSPTGVASPAHWHNSASTGNSGGNSPLGAHQSDCHNLRRK
uniref:Uncharacterized protein n=1 Tax=Magallana gigas TaxID=29159 RepID=A0A8W8MSB2_MAGGI